MSGAWTEICAIDEILPNSGSGALVDGQDVALFRIRDAVYALGNRDPASGVHVLAHGVVGDIGGELMVASPIFKQHYSLINGRCLEDPTLRVPVYLCRVDGGRIYVRNATGGARGSAERRRLVVVGNGMAAMRVIEELLDHAPQRYQIEVFGAEPHGGYNRVMLSSLLAGDKQRHDVLTHPPSWFKERGVVFHGADPVVVIDRAKRCVQSASGASTHYDRLLIATGSLPVRLPIPGVDLPGVVAFRDLSDVDTMLSSARAGRPAAVIGGGLLGLEAASGLQKRGMNVTVIHAVDRLMERQLDEHAAVLLKEELERRGIHFLMSARTDQVYGGARAEGVRLADGTSVAADLVVLAVGVRPNVALAQSAGLHCDRGLLVDDSLMTHDPAIYAVGECIQHRGTTFGLVAPLYEQARICAAQLAERAAGGYRVGPAGAQLKVSGIDVFSAGNFNADPGTDSLILRDPKRGIYKRLVIQGDRVRGVVLYGDVGDSSWYLDLIAQARDVRLLRNELLFGPPPDLRSNAA
jgi:NAD(P)H-dependent nitrite reductase small subunit